MKQKTEVDGGDLFTKFAKSWFIALGQVGADEPYVFPMVQLIMDLLNVQGLELQNEIALRNISVSKVRYRQSKVILKKFQSRFLTDFRSVTILDFL